MWPLFMSSWGGGGGLNYIMHYIPEWEPGFDQEMNYHDNGLSWSVSRDNSLLCEYNWNVTERISAFKIWLKCLAQHMIRKRMMTSQLVISIHAFISGVLRNVKEGSTCMFMTCTVFRACSQNILLAFWTFLLTKIIKISSYSYFWISFGSYDHF